MEGPYEEIRSVSDKNFMFSLPIHVRVRKFVSPPFCYPLLIQALTLFR